MSHVITSKAQITDLDMLEKACAALGLELARDQETFRWYGEHVGDYALPDGFEAEEMGKCSHAIRIPNDDRAYEIGVVERRDGKDGYCLMFDFFMGGYGMQEKVGQMCERLVTEYASEIAFEEFPTLSQQRVVLEDGSVVLELEA